MKIFLVGGFLGSGKTTAIQQAALYLKQNRRKVGVITNDQGIQQVDTQYIRYNNIPVQEVAGGCFCCNYDKLVENIQTLKLSVEPEVVFAESVGSCTDLAATVINPMLHFNNAHLDIVLSVITDVRLLSYYLQGHQDIFYGNVNYIYEKQLEEADILVVNKIDLLSEEQLQLAKKLIEKEYGSKTILYQNSLSEKCIRDWITILIQYNQQSQPRKTLQLDYDLYAAGEASLAWLDEEISIYDKNKNSFEIGMTLIRKIYFAIKEKRYSIGHLKFLINDGLQERKISYTAMALSEGETDTAEIKTEKVVVLINARVQTDPVLLNEIVSHSIHELEILRGCKIVERKLSCFTPGYPKPTHRMKS